MDLNIAEVIPVELHASPHPVNYSDFDKVNSYYSADQSNTTVSLTNLTKPSLATAICKVAGIASLFCVIGLVGIIGNALVIVAVVTDRKMRYSVTNLFIANLAFSDLLIMLVGLPDIVQFIINKGWLLGEAACKAERYILVVSLYSSVITLVTVCVERYIAIVYPIKAHMLCSRKKMIKVISLIWPTACFLGLPILLHNTLIYSEIDLYFCGVRFPGNHIQNYKIYRYAESLLFYFSPLLIQIVCYLIIGRQLFAGTDLLHRKQMVTTQDGVQRERSSEALKARKGVIKMLVASVAVYFISYSPHQILLIYNTFSPAPFHQTWIFRAFVTAMGYINSAVNPILYCIFSQNFKAKFKDILMALTCKKRVSQPRQYGANLTSETAVMLASFRRPQSDNHSRSSVQTVTMKRLSETSKNFV